jgi:hypothetical protein
MRKYLILLGLLLSGCSLVGVNSGSPYSQLDKVAKMCRKDKVKSYSHIDDKVEVIVECKG